MEVDIAPGKYIVAVSGGVDSMVLLDILAKQASSHSLIADSSGRQLKAKDSQLIVAHFDHGIRADSALDRELVQKTAAQYGLPFEYETGKLGPDASEAEARKARYDFLERVKAKHGAQAIITAHHQDDLLETAILNLLRGTGRKGLTSLSSRPGIVRPLLKYSKQEILAYVQDHQLQWREDSTNASDAYLRNYIRHHIIPRLGEQAKGQLIQLLEQSAATNVAVDAELQSLSQIITNGATLDRRAFGELPHDVAKELLASWLREQGIADFDRKTLERVTVAAKTKPPGIKIDLLHDNSLLVTKETLALRVCER